MLDPGPRSAPVPAAAVRREDRWGSAALLEPFVERLVGHRQITDAYLLGLAAKHGGRLATFDRATATLAPPRDPLSDLWSASPSPPGRDRPQPAAQRS